MHALISPISALIVLGSFMIHGHAKASGNDTVLDKRVTIEFVDVPIKEVLRQLGDKAACQFIYSEDLFPSDKRVTMKANGQRLKEILDHFLQPYSVYFIPDQNYVYIKQKHKAVNDKNERVINGTVTDYLSGEPMAGVNVYIDGSNVGTTTDRNGLYSLAITNLNTVLVFSL